MNEDKAYRKAKSKLKTSNMSNAKWRKLFTAISEAGLDSFQAEWKFIDEEYVLKTALPNASQLNVKRFNDGRFQPFEYKWIKSIFVPSQVRVKEKVGLFKVQDTEKLAEVIDATGKFRIENNKSGLTIFGYD